YVSPVNLLMVILTYHNCVERQLIFIGLKNFLFEFGKFIFKRSSSAVFEKQYLVYNSLDVIVSRSEEYIKLLRNDMQLFPQVVWICLHLLIVDFSPPQYLEPLFFMLRNAETMHVKNEFWAE